MNCELNDNVISFNELLEFILSNELSELLLIVSMFLLESTITNALGCYNSNECNSSKTY